MASCALRGGCPSDYLAIAIAILSITLLFARASFPFLVHRDTNAKSSSFWLVIIQVIGSFNLLLSLVMSINYFRWNKQKMWQSCYIWAVWVEGPFGFGLLLSCRIVQAFKLYHVFVKRRFLPVRSCVLLPLIVLPWIGGAAGFRNFLGSRKLLDVGTAKPGGCLEISVKQSDVGTAKGKIGQDH